MEIQVTAAGLVDWSRGSAGGSYPVASDATPAALRTLHVNWNTYVGEALQRLDAAPSEQAWWLGAVTDAIKMKTMVEQRLQDIEDQEVQKLHQNLDQRVFGDQDDRQC